MPARRASLLLSLLARKSFCRARSLETFRAPNNHVTTCRNRLVRVCCDLIIRSPSSQSLSRYITRICVGEGDREKLSAHDEALNGCSSSPVLSYLVNNARSERARGKKTWKYHYSNENSAIFNVQYRAVHLIKMKALGAPIHPTGSSSSACTPTRPAEA
jgi:hypothetical protein